MGAVLESKMKMSYAGEDNSMERIKTKKKNIFGEQVQKGVVMLQVGLAAVVSKYFKGGS